MAFERIYSITNKTVTGKDVLFELVEDGGTPSSATLPLTGYRFQFRLSRFGFGALNRSVSITLVDTSDDVFLNTFTNQIRDDIRLNIFVDGSLFFTGFADYQQIKARLFQNHKKEVTIVFVDLFQALTQVDFNSPDIRKILTDFQLSTRWTGDSALRSFDRILRQIIFINYINVAPAEIDDPDRLIYIHDWEGQNAITQTRGDSTDSDERTSSVWLNYIWLEENSAVNIDYGIGLITTNSANDDVSISGTTWNSAGIVVGTRIYDKRFRFLGTIDSITDTTNAVFVENGKFTVSSQNYFIDIDDLDVRPVMDVMNIYSRSFWFRYGFSITFENIAIVQNDVGVIDGEYLPQCTMNPIVDLAVGGDTAKYRTTDVIPVRSFLTGTISTDSASTAVNGDVTAFDTELAVSDKIYTEFGDYLGTVSSITDEESLTLSGDATTTYTGRYMLTPDFTRRSLPIIAKNNILFGGSKAIIDPYKSITYRTKLPNASVEENTTISDSLNYSDYKSPEGLRVEGYVQKIAGSGVFNNGIAVKNSTDIEDFGTTDAKSAYYHALWRFENREQYDFEVRGLLDPLIPHLTDFDDNAYIIVRGEYDLIRETTIIQESITIFEVSE